MNNADRKDFEYSLQQILNIYRVEFTDTLSTLWWAALQCFPLGSVKAALQAHVTDEQQGRFPPRPADIKRKLLASRTHNDERELWADTMRTMRRTAAEGQAFRRHLDHNPECRTCADRDGRETGASDVFVDTRNPQNFYDAAWISLCARCYDDANRGSLWRPPINHEKAGMVRDHQFGGRA